MILAYECLASQAPIHLVRLTAPVRLVPPAVKRNHFGPFNVKNLIPLSHVSPGRRLTRLLGGLDEEAATGGEHKPERKQNVCP
jgi:hypothetical protein